MGIYHCVLSVLQLSYKLGPIWNCNSSTRHSNYYPTRMCRGKVISPSSAVVVIFYTHTKKKDIDFRVSYEHIVVQSWWKLSSLCLETLGSSHESQKSFFFFFCPPRLLTTPTCTKALPTFASIWSTNVQCSDCPTVGWDSPDMEASHCPKSHRSFILSCFFIKGWGKHVSLDDCTVHH